MEALAQALVWGLQLYLSAGIVFGIAFVARGVQAVDPAAVGASWGFRLLILPGVAAFWPFLLLRWIRKTPPPEERTAHRGRR